MDKKNVVITGASGFIGFHLAIYLADLGYEVTGIDNNLRGGEKSAVDYLKKENIKYLNCDLCNQNEIRDKCAEVLSKSDYIYHLAAFNGTQNFYNFPYKVIRNSSLPTINLVDFLIENNLSPKILYTGSSESYAESTNRNLTTIPTHENALVSLGDFDNPRWSYACGKTYGEYVLSNAYMEYGIRFLIARVHNIYGPRMGLNHFFSDFIKRAKSNIFEVYGPEQTRSFCYVKDCCKALNLLMISEENAEIFNIGSTREITVMESAKIILSLMKIDHQISSLEAPSGSVARRCPDITKLKRIVGNNWETVSLEEGLSNLIQWYNFEQNNEELFK